MNRLIAVICAIWCCTSCSQVPSVTTKVSAVTQNAAMVNPASSDTTVHLFNDPNYLLRLHIDSDSYDAYQKNATLTFVHKEGNVNQLIFQESLYCMYPSITFKDFNGDHIDDILVYYYTGVRSNTAYHLYLQNPAKHQLIRVKGFELLSNPKVAPNSNIIISRELTGTDRYSFYRINAAHQLINLGHSFSINSKENDQYGLAIKAIMRETGR